MFAQIPLYKKVFQLGAVVPVYSIIIMVIFGVTHYFVFDHTGLSFEKIMFGGMFYFLASMVLITHVMSMFTSPGYVEPGWKSNKLPSESPTDNHHLYCKKCRNERPSRAHHCKICNMCTLKMDHHCPWVANCVGYRNQKYFYQFLFYATLGDLLGFVILITRLFNLNTIEKGSKLEQQQINSVWDVIWAFMTPIMIIVCACLAATMTFSIGVLFYFQTKMILNNQTTIENKIYTDPKENPFFYEDKMHNFKIVMGQSPIEWFLPFKLMPNVYNNGDSFYTPNNISSNVSKVSPTGSNYIQLGELELNESGRSQGITVHIDEILNS